MTSTAAVDRARRLLTTRSERDKQRRVGPSSLGKACDLCLAEDLLGIERPGDAQDKTPIAPLLGTAFHLYCETRSHELERESDVLVEQKVVVGEVPGYGVIKGTLDRYDVKAGEVMDWKLVGLKKRMSFLRLAQKAEREGFGAIADMKGAGQLLQYYVQLNLYAYGLRGLRYAPKTLTLLLVPRDATIHTIEDDFVSISWGVDHIIAERALERAGLLYEWGKSHRDQLETLDSAPDCFYCNRCRQTF